MMEGMLQEVWRGNHASASSAPTGGQRPGLGGPTPAPAPLSAANLEKQTQALKQAQNRSMARAGQPPAAPTTAQPPFPLGAQTSPAGNPEYFGEQRITQANLSIPPRKKAKTAAAQKSPPMAQQQAATPSSSQVKATPLTAGMKAEPAKAPSKLTCPEPGCEMSSTGFQSEEALNAHRQEEHVKPYENPHGFLREHMSAGLGLDAQGHPKAVPKPSGQEATPLAAPPMSASVSEQGQAPGSKIKPGPAPMSRGASMQRNSSAAGGRPSQSAGTPGRTSTPRLGDAKTPAGKEEAGAPGTVADDLWLGSTVDPQDLFAPVSSALEQVSGNIMSEFAQYVSLTPDDTPESSKDSGASEPTSDIPDHSALDHDLNMQLDDSDFLWNMDELTGGAAMVPHEGLDTDLLRTDPDRYILDEMTTDFSKPFQLGNLALPQWTN